MKHLSKDWTVCSVIPRSAFFILSLSPALGACTANVFSQAGVVTGLLVCLDDQKFPILTRSHLPVSPLRSCVVLVGGWSLVSSHELCRPRHTCGSVIQFLLIFYLVSDGSQISFPASLLKSSKPSSS